MIINVLTFVAINGLYLAISAFLIENYLIKSDMEVGKVLLTILGWISFSLIIMFTSSYLLLYV